MALFESYERRIDKINGVLAELWYLLYRRSREDYERCWFECI